MLQKGITNSLKGFYGQNGTLWAKPYEGVDLYMKITFH